MFSMELMKKSYFISIVICLIFCAFYAADFTKNEDKLPLRGEIPPIADKGAAVQVKVDNGNKNIEFKPTPDNSIAPLNNGPASIRQIRTVAGTPSEAEIVRKWDESRGRFNEESLKDYAGYDMDTLKSLVDGGDLKAMIALSKLYISEEYVGEYGLEYSMPLLKKAAAYGSSYAMELYAIAHESIHYDYVNDTIAHDMLLETLSWSNAAALRGDMYPNNTATLDLRRKKIELNYVDVQKIRARSEEIYNDVLAERKALGLGDFDNNVPPEVKKFFSYFGNYMDAYK